MNPNLPSLGAVLPGSAPLLIHFGGHLLMDPGDEE